MYYFCVAREIWVAKSVPKRLFKPCRFLQTTKRKLLKEQNIDFLFVVSRNLQGLNNLLGTDFATQISLAMQK